jgi:hypothetical protein
VTKAPANTISAAGRELLLVDVGGGSRVHLAGEERPGRAAVDLPRHEWSRRRSAALEPYSRTALSAPRWRPVTLCGKVWWDMAPSAAGAAPTCRSCMRSLDRDFPTITIDDRVEDVARRLCEGIAEHSGVTITHVPGSRVEPLRRAVRSRLRSEYGFGVRSYSYDDLLYFDSEDVRETKGPLWLRERLHEAALRVDAGPSDDVVPHRFRWVL